MQVPVITTSHFSQADCDLLYDRESCFMCDNDGSSVILLIEEPDNNPEELSAAGAVVLTHFRDLGYVYLRIDCSGEVVEGLPVYDW
jgi:hypothetical protein